MRRSSPIDVLLFALVATLVATLVACDRRPDRPGVPADSAQEPSAVESVTWTAAPGAAMLIPQPSCADPDDWRGCWRQHESTALASRRDVRRDARRLVFRTSGGDSVVLVDDDPAREARGYYLYVGWVPRVEAHAVWGMGYESSALLLMQPASGALTVLDDAPSLSPGATWLGTASFDTEAQEEPNRVQIYRVARDSLRLIWEIAPEDWGPDSLEWQDDSTLVIRRAAAAMHPEPARVAMPLVVRYRGGQWVEDSLSRSRSPGSRP